ncbi:farnesoate epoxidase-like [Planococcus citri]|uniref:farnesoate epoxidase-like n=1 Tax=Planococcus citri TaxID=170843 RepID=UPI0031F9B7E5
MILEIGFNIYLAILMVIFLLYCIKDCKRPKNFPTGPRFLPFIGTSWIIPAKGMEYLIPKWKNKYGNFIGHKFYHKKLVVFCGSQEIIEGLKHPNFQGRYVSEFLKQRTHNKALGFFFADDETWCEVRRFALRYFGTVFTKELENILHDELLEEFGTIRSGDIHQIDRNFMKSALNAILKIMVGVHRKDFQSEIDEMIEKTGKAFAAGRPTGIESVYPFFSGFFQNHLFVDAAHSLQKFLKARLEERKKSFDSLDIKDYTDAFINESLKELQLHGKVENFTDEEFLSCGTDLVQAGNEAVVNTVQFILLYVAMNQRIQLKLHEEIDRVIGSNRYPSLNDKTNMAYLEATIHEGMRINPIAPIGAMHRVTKDTQFREYFFEKDTLITFALKYAMHDPEYWQNPDKFLPERFIGNESLKKKIITFGLGKRSCIGEVFSRNFVFLYLAYFFQRFSIKLPQNDLPSTDPILGFTNGPKPFKLIITKRERMDE